MFRWWLNCYDGKVCSDQSSIKRLDLSQLIRRPNQSINVSKPLTIDCHRPKDKSENKLLWHVERFEEIKNLEAPLIKDPQCSQLAREICYQRIFQCFHERVEFPFSESINESFRRAFEVLLNSLWNLSKSTSGKHFSRQRSSFWSAEKLKLSEQKSGESISCFENFVDLCRQLHNRNAAFLLKNPLAAN